MSDNMKSIAFSILCVCVLVFLLCALNIPFRARFDIAPMDDESHTKGNLFC